MSESSTTPGTSVLQVRTSSYGDISALRSATNACDCGHLVDAHDPIASRYCKATAFNAMSRGCICLAGAAADRPGGS